jgi:hypothetical protein
VSGQAPGGIDVHTPNSARIYDYMLGGKDNFAADREAAEQVFKAFPESRDGAHGNRRFLGGAVRHLAAEAGIRQFVDIGAGLPTQDNVHQVARSVADDCRTVYVDNDPVVCVHGRALLANIDTVAMVEGDVRKPLDLHEKVTQTGLIDWSRPVCVLLVALLHYIEDPYEHLAELRGFMAPGSHLVITHLTENPGRRDDTARLRQIYAGANVPVVPRTVEEVKGLFGDFELLDTDSFFPRHLYERFKVLGWGGIGRKR